ncbi:hypothetical protein Ahy_A01g002428 [Arachis hypogaea]|uniref:Uncharacterized protein n=1 Tax=Arachis hypogaea TaxID=3818 RepID=A0A445ER29_ARAHY|nr:hypothetical protein Ahy_A01g002428 [Arachis hypogaea]
MGATAASSFLHDDSQIPLATGDSVPVTSRPFRLPCNKRRPAPQTSTDSSQNSLPGHVNLGTNANKVDSLDEEVDDLIDASGAQSSKGRKTIKFWTVKIIDSDVTIKPTKLNKDHAQVQQRKASNGDEAGLLSGVLGLLGSDYENFLICEKRWRKITTKDKVSNKCVNVKQIFHFDENSKGTIKKNILKSMGKSWKETRLRLYDDFYEPTFTTEQNIEHRLMGIDREHWRWFLDYHAKAETKDESSRVLSQNDSIAQVFEKERPGRVCGVGSGPTHSQLFSPNSHAVVNRVQVKETQRKLLELQVELEGKKLKRKEMENEAVAEKKKRQAMESALIYLYQWQGEKLPPEIAAGMSSVE